MAGGSQRKLRLGLAAVMAAGVATFGFGVLLGVTPAHAQPLPLYKMCTGPNSDGTSQPGGTTKCEVHAVVPNAATGIYAVKLTGPGSSQIISCGPAGTNTATLAGNVCTYTVGAAVLPNDLIGTEMIFIGFGTTGGSITQTAYECGPPNPLTPCPPPTGFTPVSTIGNGSCVGAGNTVSPTGGCSAGLGVPTPTPSGGGGTPTPTNSENGGGGGNGGGENSEAAEATSQVQAAATATKFTEGPDHPFPLAATGVASGGLLLALAAGAGPAFLRRRRQSRSGN